MRSVILLSLLSLSFGSTTFYEYKNGDNVKDRYDEDGVTNLGKAKDAASCEALCVDALGSDATDGCTSYTFYESTYYDESLARTCWGDSTGSFAPFYTDLGEMAIWGNVTTSQNEPRKYQTPCSDADDCSQNGVCNDDGFCDCYPQWMGKYCGQLNLVPTNRSAGLQSQDVGGRVSSWGGSVLKGSDGKYHMFAAEMTYNCGIVVWMSNSLIRHAVATSPEGPYISSDITSEVKIPACPQRVQLS